MLQKEKDDILNKFMPAFDKVTSQSGMSQVMGTGIYHVTLAILKEVLNSINTDEISESEESEKEEIDVSDILNKPSKITSIRPPGESSETAKITPSNKS